MKFIRYLLVVLLILCFGGKSIAADDSLRVQLKWWHQFQFAGYYAAEHKGYYKEEGLKVKLIPGDPAHAPVSEVLAGKADFGITGSDLVVEYANGQPVVALGGDCYVEGLGYLLEMGRLKIGPLISYCSNGGGSFRYR